MCIYMYIYTYTYTQNSTVFQDQRVRQINSAISVVYSQQDRRYFLNFPEFLPAMNLSMVNTFKLI